MKNIMLLIGIIVISISSIMAQIPQSFSFQGLVRDGFGVIYTNQAQVTVKFTILDGAQFGPIVYEEKFEGIFGTNSLGTFQTQIGTGTPLNGTIFTNVDWSSDKWLKIEIDPVGNIPGVFTILEFAKILTAPYAFYAETSGQTYKVSDLTDVDLTGLQNGQVLVWNNTSQAWEVGNMQQYLAGVGIILSGSTISADNGTAIWNAEKLRGTEIATNPPSNGQALIYNLAINKWEPTSLNLTPYSASTGINIAGTVISALNTTPIWNANQLLSAPIVGTPTTGQVLNYNGTNWSPTTLNLTPYSAGTGINISGANQISALSTDPLWNANKLQGFGIAATVPTNGQLLKYNNISGNYEPSNDNNTTYTAGLGININGSNSIINTAPDQTVTMTGSGATTVTGTYPNFTISSTDNTVDADANSTNEIQTLSILTNTLSLSLGGGSVALDGSTTNELQTLSLAGTNLSISTGNTVSLSTINTDNQTLSLAGSNLTISGGNTIALPSSAVTAGFGLDVSGSTVSLENPLTSSWGITGNLATSGYITIGNPSLSGVGVGDIRVVSDVIADVNVHALSGYVSSGGHIMTVTGAIGPSSAFGTGDIAATRHLWADNNITIGGIAYKPGGGTWTAPSDIRLKDIHGNYLKGLKEIVQLQTIVYNYKKGNPINAPSDKTYIGFGAQDVQKIIPEAVTKMEDADGNETEYFAVNNDPIIMAAINAIKELKEENDALKKELKDSKNAQAAQMQLLEKRLKKLEEK